MSTFCDLRALGTIAVTLYLPTAFLAAESHRVSASMIGGLGSESTQFYGITRQHILTTSWGRTLYAGPAAPVLIETEARADIYPKRERLSLSYEYLGSYAVSLSRERKYLESTVGFLSLPGGFLGTGFAGLGMREDRKQHAMAFVRKFAVNDVGFGIGCEFVEESANMPATGGSLRPTQGFSFGLTPQLRATQATAKARYINPVLRVEWAVTSWFVPGLTARASTHRTDVAEALLDSGSLLAGASGPRRKSRSLLSP